MLFAVLAIAAEWRLSKLDPQDVANMAWAFATVNYRDEKLFAGLATAAARGGAIRCAAALPGWAQLSRRSALPAPAPPAAAAMASSERFSSAAEQKPSVCGAR